MLASDVVEKDEKNLDWEQNKAKHSTKKKRKKEQMKWYKMTFWNSWGEGDEFSVLLRTEADRGRRY